MYPLPRFSHIYYEDAARAFPITDAILARYSYLPQTNIAGYQEIFNRSRQHFQIQKRAQALILAVSHHQLLYSADARVKSFGHTNVSYTDQMRNCIYNCSYCFLQGMHQSAHCLLFVNERDYHLKALCALEREKALTISISYLSDLLAVEHLVPLCRSWILLARDHPHLTIEIRTKSNNFDVLCDIAPVDNVMLVWSLTPRRYAQQFEYGAASLPNRLLSARRAIECGWKVAFSFDPVIIGEDWRNEYRDLMKEVFTRVKADTVAAISYGTFRMHSNYFARILNQQPHNSMFLMGYEEHNAAISHKAEFLREIEHAIAVEIGYYYPSERLFFVHG